MTTLLELHEVDAGYDRVRVVRGLNLTVDDGEVVTMLGPNGAGKTTALRTACGLLRPQGGEVVIAGRRLPSNKPCEAARRGVSLVPEARALFYGLTVRENLRLGARGKKVSDAYRTALETFPELEPLMGRRAGLLSGGEQQMLAMARALAARPRMLIVDEMSLGLAPMIVQRLIGMLRSLADSTGVAVLFVEQYVDLALQVSDRAIVLQHGALALEGSAEELRSRRDVIESSYLGS
jgi:branched-chain amino acid transport system ATP-binding protein